MAVRVPTSVAASKGVSWLTREADRRPVTLTSHGRPVAVVISAADADRMHAELRAAAKTVIEMVSGPAIDSAPKVSFDEACRRLGRDPEEIRARARERVAAG